MKYFLSFDVGTTAMKCILFDESLKEVICINEEYDLITSETGLVEMEPETYFDTFCSCVKAILESGIQKDDILTVVFTTQGETLVPVDKNGEALHRAIVWLDARAEEEAKVILESLSLGDIYRTTGLCNVDGALPAAKLLWFYRNCPELYQNTYKFLLLEDFFIYRLTDVAVSEKSLVSSTGWYDIFGDCYYQKMLDVCRIDVRKLPEVLPCGTVVGNITARAASVCGLSENTVVITGAMDQIASAIGAGNIKEGIVTETTGTALVVGATVNQPEMDDNQPITIYKHYDHKYIYIPYCNTAGIVQKWFKDTIVPYVSQMAQQEQTSPYEIIGRMAAASPAGSNGVILFPHFAGKSEPDGIPAAKGVFFGLQLGSTQEDLCRSVLEGVAYMLREILEMQAFQKLQIVQIRSLGGGSYSRIWNEIKASVCKKEVVPTGYAQTTALGAAILGAVAVGIYDSVETATASASHYVKESVCPEESLYAIYNESYRTYKKLCEALKQVF